MPIRHDSWRVFPPMTVGSTIRPAAAALATRHGYHVLHWVHAGMSYWAVSDLNQQELSLLKQQLQYP